SRRGLCRAEIREREIFVSRRRDHRDRRAALAPRGAAGNNPRSWRRARRARGCDVLSAGPCAVRSDPLAFTAMRPCPEGTTLPDTSSTSAKTESPAVDPRLHRVWCAFLDRLATDAEAALAVAMAYRELDGLGRDVWISALEQDADRVSVPRIAVYAPLLAVEADQKRRQRLLSALGPEQAAA